MIKPVTELKPFYQASATKVTVVDVPRFNFLMIDGTGDPNTSAAYAQAVEALYSVSYTIKFALKKATHPVNYTVMPLEGLWWAEDMSAFLHADRSKWQWTMMILQPDVVSAEAVDQAVSTLKRKKDLPALGALRLASWAEGRCAQTLHVGPFSEEGPTIARVHAFIHERSGLRGKHHEIYLSDIRRAHPSRWKTIVRQPML